MSTEEGGRRKEEEKSTPDSGRMDDEAPLVECEGSVPEQESPCHVDVRVEVDGVPVDDEPDPTPDRPQGPGFVRYKCFEKLPTIPAAAFSMFASAMMIASVFGVPIACLRRPGEDDDDDGEQPPLMMFSSSDNRCPVEAFSLLIYFHVFYWFTHLVIDPYLKKHHKRNRMKGYLEFYLNTKNVRRAPFYLVSVGNFGLLLVSTILHDFCESYPDSCVDRFSKVDWLRGLITCEAMAIFFLFGYYIIKIREFNRSGQYPDVMREKYMRALGSTLVLKFPKGNEECGPEEEVHVAGANQRELVAMGPQEFVFGRTWEEEEEFVRVMQAELIRFLITQIKRKNRKVVTLTKHLSRYTDDVQALVSRGIEM